jgi:hypothetical protein
VLRIVHNFSSKFFRNDRFLPIILNGAANYRRGGLPPRRRQSELQIGKKSAASQPPRKEYRQSQARWRELDHRGADSFGGSAGLGDRAPPIPSPI